MGFHDDIAILQFRILLGEGTFTNFIFMNTESSEEGLEDFGKWENN